MCTISSCTYADFGCILICYLKEQKKGQLDFVLPAHQQDAHIPTLVEGQDMDRCNFLCLPFTQPVWLRAVPRVMGKAANQCSAGGTVLVKFPRCPTEVLPSPRVRAAAKEMLVACSAAHSH